MLSARFDISHSLRFVPFRPPICSDFCDPNRIFFPLSSQVEFYFSDSNLPRDGFLRRTVEESEDGCKNPLVFISDDLAGSCRSGANFVLSPFGRGADWAVVSLALICSFSRMRSHLGLEGDVKPDTMPEETVLAVADVLRRSTALRVSEDGKLVISPFSSI